MQFSARLTIFATVLIGLLAFRTAHAQSSYILTDLGTLPGQTNSQAESISGNGLIAGRSGDPVLWSGGTIHDLGTFGGSAGEAHGVNDNGWVVGHALRKSGYQRAFVYHGSGLIDLTGQDGSIAWAISPNNQIVGDAGGQAFSWANGVVTYLPSLAKRASASARTVNSHGLIGGYAYVASGSSDHRPVYWSGGQIYALPGLSTSILTGAVWGSNDNNVLVGDSYISSTAYHAVVWWTNGAPQDLGTLGGNNSKARTINSLGTVVGISDGGGAFVWTSSGGMINLNTLLDPVTGSGWVLNDAYSINDSGQIVGSGTLNGYQRAFLLTPGP